MAQLAATISGTYDVVVVGAGIMGSCIAYQIAKRGRSVLLVEQFDLLHRRGSSHGETRTIRVAYPEEYYTRMMKEAFLLWEEAQQEAGYMVHTKSAHLDIGPISSESIQAVVTSCMKHGIKAEVLNPAEAAARFPAFELGEGWMAVVTPQGGVIHASKAVAMFQLLAAKNGAHLRDRTKVTRIASGWRMPDGEDGVLVATNKGSVLCRKCVIAVGAWTNKLVREIDGLKLPIQALHTTICYWQIEEDVSAEFSVPNGFPTFASYGEPYIYGTPSIEYPGLIKVSVHSGFSCDPDNRALVPDIAAAKKFVTPWLVAHFKGKVKAESPVLAEACMYSMTPDEDFIMDFLPMKNWPAGCLKNWGQASNVLVTGGFSGHGFKWGPLVGKVMADLCLQGVSEGFALEYFSISRFLRDPRGNVKNFGEQVVPHEMQNPRR